MSEPLELAAGYPSASRDQWRALAAAALRRSHPGADVDTALATRTYDDIEIAPLYTAADAPPPAADPGQAPFVRGSVAAAAAWDVRQRHADPDPIRTNAAILADLAGGVTSLWLSLGADAIALTDLPAVLDGVLLDLAPIALDAGEQTREAAAALLELAAAQGVAAAQLAGTLGADPIGTRARTGAPAELAELAQLAQLAQLVAESANLTIATVDGTLYHDAGGSDADELAVATAIGVAYLRALVDGGLSVDAALTRLEFRFAVSADQFASIAKLRAGRQIWDRVAELSGASPDRAGQFQHAVTSAAMMARRDPYTNLLRTTIACFAAAVGGARAITVAPFDAAIGRPDDFARRIARNTQAVLHDESSLGRVLDAAGGSWYLEAHTAALAEQAWARFTAIERGGGALAALEDGTLDAGLGVARERRAADVARRHAPIIGVSEFAFVAEQPVVRSPWPEQKPGRLPVQRPAEPFELLRDRSDAHRVSTGARPRVFLAALGSSAAHSGRVGFATNVFQAGGLELVTGSGAVAEIVAAFTESGSTVACLCSSDPVYVDQAAPIAAALKASGAAYVWLAGRPGEQADSDAAAGIDGYLYVGVDVLAVLQITLDTLGVS
jgi:methylmalonyl-CoA mutase